MLAVHRIAAPVAGRTPLHGVGPREASSQTPGAPSPARVRGRDPARGSPEGAQPGPRYASRAAPRPGQPPATGTELPATPVAGPTGART